MKLYYMPGACSLASHIALREVGENFELEQVDPKTKKTKSGTDFVAVNPNGYVPALQLDDGEVLTEGAAILQYIADTHPGAGLAPDAGTLQRARLQEHLNFVASELHKAFSPFFAAEPPAGKAKEAAVAKVEQRLSHFERLLSDGRAYLLGDRFTVADAYLFVVANWATPTGIGLEKWPSLAAYLARIAARKPAQEALRAEGLVH